MTKTVQLNTDQIEERIARFSGLHPNTEDYLADYGIPEDAYRYTAAYKIFTVLAASNPDVGASTKPAIEGKSGASVYICETPPGDGPAIHAHMRTLETFMVLKGSYEFSVGDFGQHKYQLSEFDTFSCPAGVSRKFQNTTDETALLLVIIQGDPENEALDDIAMSTDVAKEISKNWGEEAVRGLEKIGMSFDVEPQH